MQPMSWWKIIAILIGVAFVSGMLMGVLGDLLGLSPSVKSGGMAAPVAILAPILIARRRSSTVNNQK